MILETEIIGQSKSETNFTSTLANSLICTPKNSNHFRLQKIRPKKTNSSKQNNPVTQLLFKLHFILKILIL